LPGSAHRHSGIGQVLSGRLSGSTGLPNPAFFDFDE
jgi:hypothetical protein